MEIKKLYMLHGILQTLAFLILFPIGIIIALCKNYIGPRWFILHISFQSFGIICVFTAIILAVYAESLKSKDAHIDGDKEPVNNKSEIPSLHVILGIIVIILLITQIIWAVFVRKIINHDLWAKIHLILALLILGFGWTNIYLGYKHYKSQYNIQKDTKNT